MTQSGLNHVTLIGRLATNPELRYLESGIAMVKVELRCSETYTDKQGRSTERTDMVPVTLWRGQAELLHRNCKMGDRICVEGKIRSWKRESEEGNFTNLEVHVRKLILLDAPRPGQQATGSASTRSMPSPTRGGGPARDGNFPKNAVITPNGKPEAAPRHASDAGGDAPSSHDLPF